MFFEEKRRREEEQQRREEEQRKQEQAEDNQREEQRKREKAEEKTRETTLPQALDACHIHLHAGPTILSDSSLSTKGDPSNACTKKRRDYTRKWIDFPAWQVAIWEGIVKSDFMKEAGFTFINTMYELGEMTGHRMMSSELDVHHFECSTVEDHISTIIWGFHENKCLRREFNTKGSVRFENHGNTLSADDQLSGTVEELDLSDTKRQHSPRLVAREWSKENEGSRGS